MEPRVTVYHTYYKLYHDALMEAVKGRNRSFVRIRLRRPTPRTAEI